MGGLFDFSTRSTNETYVTTLNTSDSYNRTNNDVANLTESMNTTITIPTLGNSATAGAASVDYNKLVLIGAGVLAAAGLGMLFLQRA